MVLIVVLIGLLYVLFIPRKQINKLEEATNRISMYLSYARYQAFIDDEYSNGDLWHKKRWTMKFFRCRENGSGGIYFSICNEKNDTGHPNQRESLRDPLTSKYIHGNNFCKENNKNNKYTLLSKNFDIEKVNISCNNTNSLGQISFGNDGKVYSKLSHKPNEAYEYEINTPYFIQLTSKKQEKKEMKIYPRTAFIE